MHNVYMCSDLKHSVFTFCQYGRTLNTFSVKQLLKNYRISLDIKHSGYGKSTARVIYPHSTAHR